MALQLMLAVFIAAAQPAVMYNGVRIDRALAKNHTGAETNYWIVVLNQSADGKQRGRLEQAGHRVLGYLPRHGFLVQAQPYERRGGPRGPSIDYACPLVPSLKIAAEIDSPARGKQVDLLVHVAPNADVAPMRQQIAALGVVVAGESSSVRQTRIAVRVPAERRRELAAALAGLDDVLLIQRASGARLLLDHAVPIVQSGVHMGGRSMLQSGLDGSGQVVALCDTGIDIDICWFRDPAGERPAINSATSTAINSRHRKVLAVNFYDMREDPANSSHWDTQDHGTAVAACIGAAQIDAPTASDRKNGMAPHCKLVVQDAGYQPDVCADLPGLGCPVMDLAPLFAQAQAQGARIHNNSWGDREELLPRNVYSIGSHDVDAFTWENKDFLIVFAAGNSGGEGDNSVISPATAKNCVAVGATRNGAHAERMASFSSNGWAEDGRIKPDLCAPGEAIQLADSDGNITTMNCGTKTSSGTSFAAPLAAGAAAVVRQYFVDGYYPSEENAAIRAPSAALLKAMLIHGAVNISGTTPRPSRRQGWGRISLSNTLDLGAGTKRLYVWDERTGFFDADSAPLEVRVRVRSFVEPFNATLVYTDYPATMGASPQLVNDLDLAVATGGEIYHGNHWDNGASISGGAPDRLNNVERVYLPAPSPGTYLVRVAPGMIVYGPQDFALILSGDIEILATSDSSLLGLY